MLNYKSETPEISVIIPVYNAAGTIRTALTSVFRQTYENIQIIVINDGSTDNTLKQVAALTDPRLEIHSYPNSGVCSATNRGMEKATGEYIAFLDADDFWAPEKLASQLNALRNHPEASVVYSQVNAVDSQGEFLFRYPFSLASGNVSSRIMESCFIVSGSNLLIKKDCLKHTGFFNPSLVCFGDWEYAIRLARRYQFLAVRDYHINYRYQNDSLSANVFQMEKDGLAVITEQVARPFRYEAEAARAFVYRHLTFVALFRTNDPGRCRLALGYLAESARHSPRSVISIEYLRLIAAGMLLACLPGNSSIRCCRWLLKTYNALSNVMRRQKTR